MKMVYIPKNPQKLKKTAASKYRNKKVRTRGITFDSIGERNRWLFLMDEQRNGYIQDLIRQPRFSLDVDGFHICDYVADFAYTVKRNAMPDFCAPQLLPRRIVEDFKGVQTAEFKLKKNLMMACHGIEIRIVKSPTEPV